MGLKIPPEYRRDLVKAWYDSSKTACSKEYDAVIVDVSAMGRHLMAPFGSTNANISSMATSFVRTVLSCHPACTLFVLCYDNPSLTPAIRDSLLHENRYGVKLDAPPADMNTATHVFVEGRVYSKLSPKIPASPIQVETSTITMLQATIDQMLASETGKKKLFAMHAECIKRACETALATNVFHSDAVVKIVPPFGDTTWVLQADSHVFEPRLTQYGEADMLIMAHAERALALGKRVCLRTIDTDAILQGTLFTAQESSGGVLDLHIANVFLGNDGVTVSHTASKAGPKATRCREIIDLFSVKTRLSFESQMLMLVFGGDYIKGVCIRSLGLPKRNLFNAIANGAPEPFIRVSREHVTIQWDVFFKVVGKACKQPKPTAKLNVSELNLEMQRLAYCVVYFSGVASERGGPDVDTRTIVLPEANLRLLFAGRGSVGELCYS